jgi:hypothetical protein
MGGCQDAAMVIEVNEEALDDDDLDSESESTSEPCGGQPHAA